MAPHIRDERTVALVRELASRRSIALTEAARQAVDDELVRRGAPSDDGDASSARMSPER